MATVYFPAIFRYFWLLVIGVLAVDLLYGRARAAALVAAGRITQQELDNFIRGAALLVGGFFFLFGLFQMLGPSADPLCLMAFPPHTGAGRVLWLAQAFLSAATVWWLWARDGTTTLARLAPAFTRGPVLERQFSPRVVGLALTGLVVLAPLGNILLQLIQPVPCRDV